MIREDLNVLSPFQIVSPMAKAHYNGHELFVVHRVSQLGTSELARVVGDRVLAVFERLGQNTSQSVVGSVGLHADGT